MAWQPIEHNFAGDVKDAELAKTKAGLAAEFYGQELGNASLVLHVLTPPEVKANESSRMPDAKVVHASRKKVILLTREGRQMKDSLDKHTSHLASTRRGKSSPDAEDNIDDDDLDAIMASLFQSSDMQGLTKRPNAQLAQMFRKGGKMKGLTSRFKGLTSRTESAKGIGTGV